MVDAIRASPALLHGAATVSLSTEECYNGNCLYLLGHFLLGSTGLGIVFRCSAKPLECAIFPLISVLGVRAREIDGSDSMS